MTTGTVRLHRVIRAPAERIYRAFLNADAMVKWLPPHGFTGHMHELDVKVGGKFRMSFTNFTTQHAHAFGGEYLTLTPYERIAYANTFDDPNLSGTMQVDIALKKAVCGTDVTIVQTGIPAVIPTDMCYLGWQESLQLLAQLVEADIRE